MSRPSRTEDYRARARAADKDRSWMDRAVCRVEQIPTAVFYDHNPLDAMAVCVRCPVSAQCRMVASLHEEAYGVWGGKRRHEPRKRGSKASDDEIAAMVLKLVQAIAKEVA